ncbi:MAG: phage portal protein, partial [Oscillospiraceae bacterium]|nr:phage portal protein [Oscillospiraceae bacterium]
DLKRSTFNNIEHQGIAFVQYSLMPWIIRIEKGIMKDLLLEEEQDVYFPKFNVDGLMRGDYQSRMNAYAIGVGNGFMSPNDVRRLENMDLIPDEQGGNDYYLNGSYNKLQDAGAAYDLNAPQEDEQPDTEEQDTPDENPDEETDDRFLRKKRRTKHRNGGM